MEFSRQEYWSGLPFPTPGDLPHPGIEFESPVSPALAGRVYHCATWKAQLVKKTNAQTFFFLVLLCLETLSDLLVFLYLSERDCVLEREKDSNSK